MNTLFDFITHVKGVEYIVGLMFIAGYLLYWEVLKPKPFTRLAEAAKAEAALVKEHGSAEVWKTIGKVAAAPFIGMAYVVALPFGFVFALGAAGLEGVLSVAGRGAAFNWRPVEAYFGGKKKGKKSEKPAEEKEVK